MYSFVYPLLLGDPPPKILLLPAEYFFLTLCVFSVCVLTSSPATVVTLPEIILQLCDGFIAGSWLLCTARDFEAWLWRSPTQTSPVFPYSPKAAFVVIGLHLPPDSRMFSKP